MWLTSHQCPPDFEFGPLFSLRHFKSPFSVCSLGPYMLLAIAALSSSIVALVFCLLSPGGTESLVARSYPKGFCRSGLQPETVPSALAFPPCSRNGVSVSRLTRRHQGYGFWRGSPNMFLLSLH